MRVYELAKELGIDSKALMRHLSSAGEFVRSASSTINPAVVRRTRQHYAGTKPTRPTHPARSAPVPTEDLYAEAERIFGRPVTRPRAPRRKPVHPRPVSFSTPVPTTGKSIPKATDAYDADWASRYIEPAVRNAYLEAGLDRRSASVVEQCLMYEVTPADLSRRIDGVPVVQRLRNRESVAAIAARLRQSRTP